MTSTTTVGSLSGTVASSVPAASKAANDTDQEKENDKGSLSTTLVGTHHTHISHRDTLESELHFDCGGGWPACCSH
jgi:peptide methionine sulfoxide reductase MsrB